MALSLNQTTLSGISMNMEIAQCKLDTYLGSTEFIQKLIGPSIASILNRRVNITPHYLKGHTLEGESYFGFNINIPKDHPMYEVSASRHQLKMYIEKKYIDEMILLIIDKESKNMQEQFMFTFKYNPEGNGKVESGRIALKLAEKFFNSINRVSNENRYKEEGIVIKYGFKFNDSMPQFLLEKELQPVRYEERPDVENLNIATLKTPFHKLSILTARRKKLSTKKPLKTSEELASVIDLSSEFAADTLPIEFFSAVDDLTDVMDSNAKFNFSKEKPTKKQKSPKALKKTKPAAKAKPAANTPVRRLRSTPKPTPGCSKLVVSGISPNCSIDNIDDLHKTYFEDVDGFSFMSSRSVNTSSKLTIT